MSIMKVYLAAPIFTPEQLKVVNFLKDGLESECIAVFSPYHNSQAIWRGRAPKDCTQEERDEVLQDNILYIKWCNVLLAWVGGMGGYTDPGVVWELGYAKASQKFLMAYIDDHDERQAMNLMLAGTIDAVVKGKKEYVRCLPHLAGLNYPVLQQLFDPDRHLAHEKEPIV